MLDPESEDHHQFRCIISLLHKDMCLLCCRQRWMQSQKDQGLLHVQWEGMGLGQWGC